MMLWSTAESRTTTQRPDFMLLDAEERENHSKINLKLLFHDHIKDLDQVEH